MKLTDWRVERLEQLRTLINQADSEVIEEIKWRKPSNPNGIPVWSHAGMICTGETYKDHLRLTFGKRASFPAMVIHEEDRINEIAFKDLIRAAVKLNLSLRS